MPHCVPIHNYTTWGLSTSNRENSNLDCCACVVVISRLYVTPHLSNASIIGRRWRTTMVFTFATAGGDSRTTAMPPMLSRSASKGIISISDCSFLISSSLPLCRLFLASFFQSWTEHVLKKLSPLASLGVPGASFNYFLPDLCEVQRTKLCRDISKKMYRCLHTHTTDTAVRSTPMPELARRQCGTAKYIMV